MTQDLGRYLGVPVLHGRITKQTYKYIMDKIDQRLAGWKADNLSLAGRVTLAMSVLNALPSYAMQTAMLPASVCDYLDRKIRAFIWGSQQGRRRIHLINWETVCLPKSQGGLGLRSARELNTTYFLKLAWTILKHPEELWVRVLKEKYLREGPDGVELRKRTRCSHLWHGVRRVWGIMLNGTRWSVRNGQSTLFWTDKWTDSGTALEEFARTEEEGFQAQATVADMTLETGEWNFDLIARFLPMDLALQVVGMPPPREHLGEDEIVWGLEEKGNFTIKSAYQLAADIDGEDADDGWQKVWRWPGPNRVRHFLWLMAHGSLLTNVERERRHLSTSTLCTRCKQEEESPEHVFRNCVYAREVWKQTLPTAVNTHADQQSFKEWFMHHLSSPEKQSRDWEVRVQHIYREANFLADCLAHKGHLLDPGSISTFFSDPDIDRWLLYDSVGGFVVRSINCVRAFASDRRIRGWETQRWWAIGGLEGFIERRCTAQWLCKWLRAGSEYLRCGAFKRWESCRFQRLREKGGMGEERFLHRRSQEKKDPSSASELIHPSTVNLL
ncbi:unnamed protein product [Linum tenue]|uniref:Reverse transcriptase zinc-binding domain-containing protein n=1 Tax=Linum tenue TaxID=586396 RepID=A0AAV0L675_9ROSI|nr:unnamed protein product [Linum tenue]